MYAYKKNGPRTLAFQEAAEQESENFASPRRGSSLRDELKKLPSLFKRRESRVEGGAKPEAEGSYRRPENLIATGSIGSVYQYGNDYVMKDYSGIVEPGMKGRLIKAQNNTAAFNRYYGQGSASMMMRETANPLQKAVSVKLKRIKGEPLAAILATKNIALAQKALESLSRSDVAAELVKKLEMLGIEHMDINAANILYDPQSEEFNLIDFDDANINKPGEPLNEFAVEQLVKKMAVVFRVFRREVEEMRSAMAQQ